MITDYINGEIGDNRVLTLDPFTGYTGEQNAQVLKIDIASLQERNPDYYILSFETSPYGEVFIIAKQGEAGTAYIEENYLYCPIGAAITSSGEIRLQISAVITETAAKPLKKQALPRLNMSRQ